VKRLQPHTTVLIGGPLDVVVDLEDLLEMPLPRAVCPWHLYGYSLIDGTSPQGLKVMSDTRC